MARLDPSPAAAGGGGTPVVAALADVWTSIEAACAGLVPPQWDLATECPGWSVRDQISHLIGIERVLLGDPTPPPVGGVPEYVHNAIGEMNEAWVEARRLLPGDQVLAEFAEVAARRVAELEAMPPERFDEFGPTLLGDRRYGDFLETRLFDSWVHEQDIRRALDRPGGRGGPGETGALALVALAMGKVVGKSVAPPEGTTVVWEVHDDSSSPSAAPAPSVSPVPPAGPASPAAPMPPAAPASTATLPGPGGLPFTLAYELRGGRAQRAGTVPEAPTVCFTLGASTFLRLGCGRITPTEALAQESVSMVGDRRLAMAILEASNFMF